jgi:hypothetical protein
MERDLVLDFVLFDEEKIDAWLTYNGWREIKGWFINMCKL